jgi:hypothetical protein
VYSGTSQQLLAPSRLISQSTQKWLSFYILMFYHNQHGTLAGMFSHHQEGRQMYKKKKNFGEYNCTLHLAEDSAKKSKSLQQNSSLASRASSSPTASTAYVGTHPRKKTSRALGQR